MTQDQPNRLDNLEAALGRFAELTMQNVVRHDEAKANHDEVLSRLEANVARHDENFLRMESTLNELVRTMAEMTVQSNRDRLQNEALHAQHRAEIEEIWRYLRYEPRNGNGRGEG